MGNLFFSHPPPKKKKNMELWSPTGSVAHFVIEWYPNSQPFDQSIPFIDKFGLSSKEKSKLQEIQVRLEVEPTHLKKYARRIASFLQGSGGK